MALRDYYESQTSDNSLDERKWEHRRNQHKVLMLRRFEPSTSRMPSKHRTIRPWLPLDKPQTTSYINTFYGTNRKINYPWLYASFKLNSVMILFGSKFVDPALAMILQDVI